MSFFRISWVSPSAARWRLLHDRAAMLAVAFLLGLMGALFIYLADHYMSPEMSWWARQTILVMIALPYVILVIFFMWNFLTIEGRDYGVE